MSRRFLVKYMPFGMGEKMANKQAKAASAAQAYMRNASIAASKTGNFLLKCLAGVVITYGVYKALEVHPHAHDGRDRTVVVTKDGLTSHSSRRRGPWPGSYTDPPMKPQPSVASIAKSHSLFLWIKIKPLSDFKDVVSSMARLPHYVYQVTGPILAGSKDEVLAGVGFGPEMYRMGAGGAPRHFTNRRHHLIKRREPAVGDSVGGDVLIHAKSNNIQYLINLNRIVLNALPINSLDWHESVIATDDTVQIANTYKQDGSSPLGMVNHDFKTGQIPPSYASPPTPEDRMDMKYRIAVDPANGGSYVIAQKWVHNWHVVDTLGDMTIDTFMGRAWDDCVAQNKNRPGYQMAADLARNSLNDWVGQAFSECQEMRRRHPNLKIRCKAGTSEARASPFRMLRQSMPYAKDDYTGMMFIAYSASPLDHEMLVERLAACSVAPASPAVPTCTPDASASCPDPPAESPPAPPGMETQCTGDTCVKITTPGPGVDKDPDPCPDPKVAGCNLNQCPSLNNVCGKDYATTECSRAKECEAIFRWAHNERTACWYFPGKEELKYLE